MPKMTDPTDSLISFQEILPLGVLPLRPGELDRTLGVLFDEPVPGVRRFTYVRLDGATVTAMALLVSCEPIYGHPCFALGYAVPPAFRGNGRATEIVTAALAEMSHGFGRAGVLPIYIEAVVGEENGASRKVASKALDDEGEPIIDSVSGLPAYRYLRRLT